jgi:endogenous inhibitor of DNA gyrase (YacG/DUF329 family)
VKTAFICKNCGRKSERYLREGQDIAFCSRACFHEYSAKTKINYICKICGKEYQHTKTYFSRSHCESCPAPDRKPKQSKLKEVVCATCGKVNQVTRLPVKGLNYYCSPKCSGMSWLVKHIRIAKGVENVS